MAQTAQIKFINKNPRHDPFHAITHVGGYGTKPWRLTLDDAINKILNDEWQFFVERPLGDRVMVEVKKSRFGSLYLKTVADGDVPNNLLDLPEYPY